MHHMHGHAGAPQTNGVVIHWAPVYNAIFGRMVRASDADVVKLAQIRPGDAVLDVGCGPGSLSCAAQVQAGASGRVHGVDAAPEMIELARGRAIRANLPVEFHVGVAEALPFPDATFDVVVSRLVIHHLTGDLKRQGFAEMRRVLKPGGVCLAVEFEPPTAWPVRQLFAHLTGGRMMRVNARAYVELMAEAGFQDITTGPTGHRLLSFVRGQVGEP